MYDFREIYETMLGLLEPEAQVPNVDDAFGKDSVCAREYEEMRQAYERLCNRFGITDEDEDLNAIVSHMENIQKDLCYRMYYLGKVFFSTPIWKQIYGDKE